MINAYKIKYTWPTNDHVYFAPAKLAVNPL